jgi:hypothetical protein
MSEKYQTPIPENFQNQSGNYYRILSGQTLDDVYPALLDFQKTGTIKGSPRFYEAAYFNKGYPDTQYYATTSNAKFDATLGAYGRSSLPTNYVMELSPYFTERISAGKNPLYQPNSLQNVGGSYYTLTPDNVKSFGQRVNPLNRFGIKLTQFTGSDMTQPKAGVGEKLPPVEFSRNPKAKVIYDTTKPFVKTSIPQHAKNALFEAGVFLEQPEVKMAANRINTFGNYASLIPLVMEEHKRATADYENPLTREVYKKDEVTNIDGSNYPTADLAARARFHPDNAENHPEITDEMRKKFYAHLKETK